MFVAGAGYRTRRSDVDVARAGNITGTAALAVTTYAYFYATLTGNCTISFSGSPTSGSLYVVALELTNGGLYTSLSPPKTTP